MKGRKDKRGMQGGEKEGGKEGREGGVTLPDWFEGFSRSHLLVLAEMCRKKNLSLENEVLACDEYWQDKDASTRSKKKPRWYSRISNWIKKSWPQYSVHKPSYEDYTEEEREMMS